jgi:hypothetical protein
MNLYLPGILLCLILVIHPGYAQKSKDKGSNTGKSNTQNRDRSIIKSTIDRGDYFYIPAFAMEDSVDAIVFQSKIMQKVDPEHRPVRLFWSSNCNDGHYILTVTPEQIFLSSGHDNPNPNFLFWVMDISKEQYSAINRGIRKKAPKNFYDVTAPRNDSLFQDESEYIYHQTSFHDPCPVPENWNKTNEQRFTACCETTLIKQTTYYFQLLNNYISTESLKLKLPDLKLLSQKPPTYFSYRQDEIREWLPHRRL